MMVNPPNSSSISHHSFISHIHLYPQSSILKTPIEIRRPLPSCYVARFRRLFIKSLKSFKSSKPSAAAFEGSSYGTMVPP